MKKRRKGGKRQHLDKVGQHTHDAAVHEQQRERSAVMDVMGMGGSGGTGRAFVWIIGVILLVVAIFALVLWVAEI
jgi:glycerate kinase